MNQAVELKFGFCCVALLYVLIAIQQSAADPCHGYNRGMDLQTRFVADRMVE